MRFDRIAVINLDRRPDRLVRFYRDYPTELPPAERFPGADWRQHTPPDGREDAPNWGCWLSHLLLIRECIRDRVDSVLIFEDDAFPRDGFAERWRALADNMPADWQFVFLGGAPRGNIPYQPINEHVMIPRGVRTTHAYAVRQPFLRQLAVALEPPRSVDHVDVMYENWLPSNCQFGYYCPSRWLFGQRGGVSDIEGVKKDDRHFRDPLDIVPVKWMPRPQPCDQDETRLCRRKRCGLINSSVCRIGNGLMDVSA